MGDRRPIAVLFTDVRGFTTLSEHTEPEVVMGALRTYFTRMVDIVLENGGTVDKYIGDGLMALFGAPVHLADPCLAAMRTALAMQSAMAEVNALLAAPLGTELRIGAGINYGEAVFGLSGAPSKLEFTAIGDTVNTASRLESLCRDKGCGIVISASVYANLPVDLQQRLRDLGVVNVKGRQMSVQVYGLAEINAETLRAAGLGGSMWTGVGVAAPSAAAAGTPDTVSQDSTGSSSASAVAPGEPSGGDSATRDVPSSREPAATGTRGAESP
jgi:adenylate cyclase